MSAIILVVSGVGLSLYVVKTNRKKAIFMENVGPDHVVSSSTFRQIKEETYADGVFVLKFSSHPDLSKIQIVSLLRFPSHACKETSHVDFYFQLDIDASLRG